MVVEVLKKECWFSSRAYVTYSHVNIQLSVLRRYLHTYIISGADPGFPDGKEI